MKFLIKLSFLVLAMALLSPFSASAKGWQGHGGKNGQTGTMQLTLEEEDTLLWMREEEKLARDVYLTFYESWREPVFSNIAASEQNHMDAILKKINQFGLDDPVMTDQVGVFNNANIQVLYNQLVEQGSESYIAALAVGATIEDMDISDLIVAIEETDILSLKTTYQSLLEGSKNHLRAFVGLLEQQEETYSVQYIDQALFDAIIDF